MRQCFRKLSQLTIKDLVEQYAHNTDFVDEEVSLLKPEGARLVSEVQLTTSFINFYDPFVYAYCSFDVPSITTMAAAMDITATDLCTVSVYQAIHRTSSLSTVMGSERLEALTRVLSALSAERDANSFSLQLNYPFHSFLFPLLRGICVCASVDDPLSAQAGFVLSALLAGDHLGSNLHIEGDYEERGLTLARMLLCTAREFGSVPVLLASLTLHQQHGLAVDYTVSKQIAFTLTAAERRRLDWRLKGSRSK